MRRFVLATLAMLVAAPHLATGQPPPKVGVYVHSSSDDTIGQKLAYSVREELRRSAAFDAATADNAVFQVRMVSVDLASPSEANGAASAVAVVFTMTNYLPLDRKDPQTWYPIYLSGSVLTVGRNRIEDQAKSIVASLDNAVEKYRSAATRE